MQSYFPFISYSAVILLAMGDHCVGAVILLAMGDHCVGEWDLNLVWITSPVTMCFRY